MHATEVVAVDLLVTSAAQARAPAQLTTHELPRQVMGLAQVSTSLHWMSQAVAVHAMSPVHAPAALHPSLHLLPAQRIELVHDPSPPHVIVHELADWQSI